MTTDSAPESNPVPSGAPNRRPASFARLHGWARRWRAILGTASILIALLAQQQVGDSDVRAALLYALAAIMVVIAFWGIDAASTSPAKFYRTRRSRKGTKANEGRVLREPSCPSSGIVF